MSLENMSIYSPEIWSKDYWVKITTWYNQKYKKFQMPVHGHERAELMHVISGSAEVDMYKNNGQKVISEGLTFVETVTLTAGETILIDSGVWHSLRVKESAVPCSISNIEFVFCETSQTVHTISKCFYQHKGIVTLLSKKLPYIVTRATDDNFTMFFLKLIDELKAFDVYGDKELQVNAMFILLFQQYLRKYVAGMEKGTYMQYARKAVQFIEEYFDTDISVESIADHININKSYLQQVFTKEIGMTIGAFITKLRIDKAKTVLKFTNITIIDVAVQVGYSSRQGFSSAFYKATGESARQYRERYKKVDGEQCFNAYEQAYPNNYGEKYNSCYQSYNDN